jgi:hypothetical protein
MSISAVMRTMSTNATRQEIFKLTSFARCAG